MGAGCVVLVLLVTAVAVVAVAAATQGDRCSFVSLATTASPTHVPSVHSTPFDPAAMRLLCLCVPRCVVLAVHRWYGNSEGDSLLSRRSSLFLTDSLSG